jgi:soluble lytic murein transglycosylase-like protein
LSLRPRRLPLPLLVSFFFCAPTAPSTARADPPAPPPPEAEALFARAADALDQGQRLACEEALRQLRQRYPLPVWESRIALLLGKEELDRGSASVAADLLSCADAGAIGLERYRSYFLAEALERNHQPELARFAFLRAANLGDFAYRASAALAFARLAKAPDERLALAVLEQAGPGASRDDLVALLAAREKIAQHRHDPAASARAAADLIFQAPEEIESPDLPASLRRRAENLRSSVSDAARLLLAQRDLDQGDAAGALSEGRRVREASLPAGQRPALFLLRARALAGLHRFPESSREALRIPRDGAETDYQARLRLAENDVATAERQARRRSRQRRRGASETELDESVARDLVERFAPLAEPPAPAEVRRAARLHLLWLSLAADDRAGAVRQASAVTSREPGATWGFDALWRSTWLRIAERDFAGALPEIEELKAIYREISVSRRLNYWQARCLEQLGRRDQAAGIFRALREADPPDLYARFAAEGGPLTGISTPAEPLESTAEFARVDELLRLRLYREALWEAEQMPDSRSRRLRLAVAQFALGRFLTATALVKSVFPQIGTAREAEVPDPWRRLYYPLESRGLVESAAKEFGLDRNLLLALVRQESAFDPMARSRAGASGLTQLMPLTARRLSKAILKKRFRKAFLYDPAVNVRLGASYLRSLLTQFHGDTMLAIAAYNAGPGRVARLLRESPGLRPDEFLESLPASETRDYVRRVSLYAESYRELYPEEKPAR